MTHQDTDGRTEEIRYERPEIIISYTEAELTAEAALCAEYGPCTAVECGN